MIENDKKYVVVLFDIIGSKKILNRAELTITMNQIIKRANATFIKDCYAPFEITQGDEIAAILDSIVNVYHMIVFFIDNLYPANIRTAVVCDQLNAGLSTKRSTIIDGPAFYLANELMSELKKTQKQFAIRTGINDYDQILEAFINIMLVHWNGLTKLQKQVIRLYQDEKNQLKVGELLHRKQQQIQYTLNSCKWQVIDEAEKSINTLLVSMDKLIGK